MKVFLFLMTIAQIQSSPEVCTTDFQNIVDDIFSIVESFEKDYWHPDPVPMKGLLASLEFMLKDCFNVNVPISHY